MASVINLLVTARDNTGRALRSAQRSVNTFGRRVTASMRQHGTNSGNAFTRGFNRIAQTIRHPLASMRSAGSGIDNFWRGIRRRLVGQAAALGSAMGSALNGNFGQALGTLSRNPAVLAGILGLVTAAISLVGAALAAALIFALGGAFAALGGVIAFHAKGMKDKWSKAINELKPLFADAAKPMIPVLDHARRVMLQMGREFAPHFKDFLMEAAPELQQFLTHVMSGFRKLGQRAWEPLKEAFAVLLDAMGPDFEQFMEGFGDALGALARTVRDHSTEISAAFFMIIGLLTTLVDVINFFANAWVEMIANMGRMTGRAIGFFADLANAAFTTFAAILTAADAGLSWIPGIGDKITTARHEFDKFRDSTVADLREVANNVYQTGARLDTLNKERRLNVNIQSWQAKIAQAKASLKSVPASKRSKIQANINDLMAKVRRAKAELAMLRNKTVYVSVNVADSSLNRTHRLMNGLIGRAMGGITGAATGGIRGRTTLVGERGPELVNLPPGSHVRSNNASRQLINGTNGGGGSGGMLYATINIDGRAVAAALVEPTREIVRTRGGGNVQQMYGRSR